MFSPAPHESTLEFRTSPYERLLDRQKSDIQRLEARVHELEGCVQELEGQLGLSLQPGSPRSSPDPKTSELEKRIQVLQSANDELARRLEDSRATAPSNRPSYPSGGDPSRTRETLRLQVALQKARKERDEIARVARDSQDRWKRKLNNEQTQRVALEQQNGKLQEENLRLSEQIGGFNELTRGMDVQKVTGLKSVNSALREKLSKQTELLNSTRQQSEGLREQLSAQAELLIASQRESERLNEALSKKTELLRAAQKLSENLSVELTDAQQQRESLVRQLHKAERRSKQLSEEVIPKFRQQLDQSASQKAEFTIRIQQLERDNDALRLQLQAADELSQLKKKDALELTDRLIAQFLGREEAAVSAKGEIIEVLSGELNRVKRENEDLKLLLLKIQRQLDRAHSNTTKALLQVDNPEMDQMLTELRDVIADLDVKNSRLTEEHERNAELLSEARRKIEELRAQLPQGDIQTEEIVAVKGNLKNLVADLNELLQGDGDDLDSPVEHWNADMQDGGAVGEEEEESAVD
jgi:DNA repair exonuclease SbcCD ATPase subunit